jgi:hypothetical protein
MLVFCENSSKSKGETARDFKKTFKERVWDFLQSARIIQHSVVSSVKIYNEYKGFK